MRSYRYSPRQAGFTAIEVSIFMIAAVIVATVSTVSLLSLGGASAQAGGQAATRGLDHATGPLQLRGPVIATRGDVDVDGNDVIDLGAGDIQAITRISMQVTGDLNNGIDLTPPYTANSTGTDPDFSTSQVATIVSVVTDDLSVPSAAWSVSFPGTDDGDSILEKGERAELTIWLHPQDVANGWYDLGSGASDPYVDSSGEALVARGQMLVRITTDSAPEMSIERTLPIELATSNILE